MQRIVPISQKITLKEPTKAPEKKYLDPKNKGSVVDGRKLIPSTPEDHPLRLTDQNSVLAYEAVTPKDLITQKKLCDYAGEYGRIDLILKKRNEEKKRHLKEADLAPHTYRITLPDPTEPNESWSGIFTDKEGSPGVFIKRHLSAPNVALLFPKDEKDNKKFRVVPLKPLDPYEELFLDQGYSFTHSIRIANWPSHEKYMEYYRSSYGNHLFQLTAEEQKALNTTAKFVLVPKFLEQRLLGKIDAPITPQEIQNLLRDFLLPVIEIDQYSIKEGTCVMTPCKKQNEITSLILIAAMKEDGIFGKLIESKLDILTKTEDNRDVFLTRLAVSKNEEDFTAFIEKYHSQLPSHIDENSDNTIDLLGNDKQDNQKGLVALLIDKKWYKAIAALSAEKSYLFYCGLDANKLDPVGYAITLGDIEALKAIQCYRVFVGWLKEMPDSYKPFFKKIPAESRDAVKEILIAKIKLEKGSAEETVKLIENLEQLFKKTAPKVKKKASPKVKKKASPELSTTALTISTLTPPSTDDIQDDKLNTLAEAVESPIVIYKPKSSSNSQLFTLDALSSAALSAPKAGEKRKRCDSDSDIDSSESDSEKPEEPSKKSKTSNGM